MYNFMEEDFSVQPKFLNGIKQKGKGGCSKSHNTKNKKRVKEVYNSKHIRITEQKLERTKTKK